MIKISLIHIAGDLRICVPEPVPSQPVRVAAGDRDEQLVLLGHVVQDLGFWLTRT